MSRKRIIGDKNLTRAAKPPAFRDGTGIGLGALHLKYGIVESDLKNRISVERSMSDRTLIKVDLRIADLREQDANKAGGIEAKAEMKELLRERGDLIEQIVTHRAGGERRTQGNDYG